MKSSTSNTVLKVLTVILGIVVIVLGVWCLFNPGVTYLSVGWIVAAAMVVDGVGGLASYAEHKKLGLADGWSLVGAILSLVFGIVLFVSMGMRVAVDLFVAYLIAAWIAVTGIMRIASAVRLRRAHKEFNTVVIGRNWGLVLVIGILLVVCGVLAFLNPAVLAITVGMLIGFSVIIAGANLVALGLA